MSQSRLTVKWDLERGLVLEGKDFGSLWILVLQIGTLLFSEVFPAYK